MSSAADFKPRHRLMLRHVRTLGRRVAVCGALIALGLSVGCDRVQNAVPADSGEVVPALRPANDSLRPAVGTGWEVAAGPFLVLPTVDGGFDAGSLVRPDATDATVGDTAGLGALKSTRLQLFSRGGPIGEADLSVELAAGLDSGCTAWPIARLAGLTSGVAQGAGGALPPGTPALPSWTAAFVKGRVTAVPMDSIEGMSPRDSATLAMNIARLASALPDDTVAKFRGLPFVVLRAYRGNIANQSFVVATLVRRVNQEDAPSEERLVMVIDGDLATPSGWAVGWHERASGREDELVVSEPLMAFQLPGGGRVHLLFGRDDGEALSAAMLVRDPATWKVLWESALAGCDR